MHERSIFPFLWLFFSFEMNLSHHDRGLTKFHAGSEKILVCVVINNSSYPTVWNSGSQSFLSPAPLLSSKKSQAPPELLHVNQKYLFLLRHYIAYYVIWIVNAQSLLKFIRPTILNNRLLLVGALCLMLVTYLFDSRFSFSQFQSQISLSADFQFISLSTQQFHNNAKPTFDQTRWRKAYQFLPFRSPQARVFLLALLGHPHHGSFDLEKSLDGFILL